MESLIFLDTETTGNSLLSDYLFQVCYLLDGKIYSQYFKPSVPISIKSQSITHVTDKMVEGKEVFADSQMKKDLQELTKDHIVIAHNAVFDIAMLDKEGVTFKKYICTLRVARFLDEEGMTPEYNLQYLRYFHELEVEADAHDAQSDVMVLKALFDYQYGQMLKKYGSQEDVLAKMVEVSGQPSLFRNFIFGKHKGKKIEDVLKTDKSYMEWLLNQKLENDPSDEDWIYTLKHYLKVS